VARDGKELFFVEAEGNIVAVGVKADLGAKPFFEPEAPLPLFEALLAQEYGPIFEYDVTVDAKRFLLDTVIGPASAPPLNVVVNWDAGLKI
jgi:hypothetical protein